MSKYYEAYDKRYKQVHEKGLAWSPNNQTEIVENTINKYNLENNKMLEIGCGEGRDAKYLLDKGCNVLAIDVSKEAIDYCKVNDIYHMDNYKVMDVLKNNLLIDNYGFIYSVACLHMLVLDEDRNNFYQFIYNHLEEDGYALILTMGDGINESKSDILKAFDDVKRVHQESNEEISVATTSCRIVNFDTLLNEVNSNGFETVEYGITKIDNHFNEIMYIIVKKR